MTRLSSPRSDFIHPLVWIIIGLLPIHRTHSDVGLERVLELDTVHSWLKGSRKSFGPPLLSTLVEKQTPAPVVNGISLANV